MSIMILDSNFRKDHKKLFIKGQCDSKARKADVSGRSRYVPYYK